MRTTVIAGYDGTDSARAALGFARRAAAALGGDVIAASVFHHVPSVLDRALSEEERAQLTREPRRRAEATLAAVPDVVHAAVGAPSAAEGLHRLAEGEDAGLIVVGATHRGPIGRLVPGSVGERLLHGSPCAVAVVPPDWHDAPVRTVAVAYDGEDQSREALRAGEHLAGRLGAERLVLLGVYEEPLTPYPGVGAGPKLDDELRRTFSAEVERAADAVEGLAAEARVLSGGAPRTLVAAAKQGVDLLVAGSRAYGPARSVLAGSVSRHLVDHAPCPVVVVPRGAAPLA